jgi:hypothetical protein
LREDCASADLVVSLVPIRRGCNNAVKVDRFDLWRGGTHAMRIDNNGALHIESVAATLGDRPWVLERMREAFRTNRLVDDPDLTADESDESAADAAGDDD